MIGTRKKSSGRVVAFMADDRRPIRDAKKPRRVQTALQDIKGACPNDVENCAVARACRRSGVAEARITHYRAYIRDEGCEYWLRYCNSSSARHWVGVFDKEGKFVEGTMMLLPPSPSERLGAPRRGGKARGNKKRMKAIRVSNRKGPTIMVNAD